MLAHDCWKVEMPHCKQTILSVVFVMLVAWHIVVFHVQSLHTEWKLFFIGQNFMVKYVWRSALCC